MILGHDLLRGHFAAFRLTWIPIIKTLLATSVDVATDCEYIILSSLHCFIHVDLTVSFTSFCQTGAFYYQISPGDQFDNYEAAVLTIAIISSILGFLTLLQISSEITNCCTDNKRPGYVGFSNAVTTLLGLEMILEDIPMFVIVTMITNIRNNGEWSPVATLKIFTSAFNFTFNLLDILSPVVDVQLEDVEDGNDGEEGVEVS